MYSSTGGGVIDPAALGGDVAPDSPCANVHLYAGGFGCLGMCGGISPIAFSGNVILPIDSIFVPQPTPADAPRPQSLPRMK